MCVTQVVGTQEFRRGWEIQTGFLEELAFVGSSEEKVSRIVGRGIPGLGPKDALG